MPRVFITGGSGFVGRHLIATFVARGDRVRALARSDAAAETVRAAGAEPVRGDLDDRAALALGVEGADWAVHAAAKVEDWGARADFLRVNVEGTRAVVAAARAAGVRRLVHVSTEAVLVGGGPIIDADEARPLPRRPLGLYPETKGLAEQVALAASDARLEVVVVRPRLIWGAGDTTLLPKIVEAIEAGRFAWIGGGRYPTSTCHVENLCRGIVLALERGRGGEVYFLADGAPVDFRAFLTARLRGVGVAAPDRDLPRALAYAFAVASEAAWRLFRLRGAPPVTRTAILLAGGPVTVSCAKAARDLGYAPRAFDWTTGAAADTAADRRGGGDESL